MTGQSFSVKDNPPNVLSNGGLPNFGRDDARPLIDAINSNEGICVFLGAGISKLAGYPLWKELSDGMVDAYYDKGKIPYGLKLILRREVDSIDVMGYLKSIDSELFKALVSDRLKSETSKTGAAIFTALEFLNNGKNFFITTNIDTEFQIRQEIPDAQAHCNPNFGGGPLPGHLYYLHGHIKFPESWIFTREQYNQNYLKDDSATMSFLVEVFSKHTVLFLGYSLRDFEVLQAIYKASNRNTQNPHRYILEGFCDHETHLWPIQNSTIWENYRIRRLGYSIEKEGHEAIFNVLSYLSAVCDFAPIGQNQLGEGNATPA